ncbi:MAG TPA: hydrolase [Rhodocyclaceae bacterium]|nr:hydrolase [Rhodocyclaceae bacterium]
MLQPTFLLCLVLLVSGCATIEPPNPAYYDIEPGQLPAPTVTLNIPGLGPCTDNPDRSLHLDANQPVNVLVHGCFGSSGNFRGLAQVLAFHGQQSACFTYDDRAALDESAANLRQALGQLSARTQTPQITLIGHSQGALISRRSLTEPAFTPEQRQSNLRLVTISGPFDGIAAARTCGLGWLQVLSLGLLPVSCHLLTGPKWADITSSSPFIRQPGQLTPEVSRYLKIDTDERDTCRQFKDGKCAQDDDIFSLAEQHNQIIETDPRMQRVVVQAGHVEIVGDKRIAPTKLIAVLQAQNILRNTPPERARAFTQLLAQVYQEHSVRANTQSALGNLP